MQQDIEGFLSSPFFHALNVKDKNRDIEWNLKESIKQEYKSDYDVPYARILKKYGASHIKEEDRNKYWFDYLPIVQEAMLDYLFEEDCIKFFLDFEEDIEKVNSILNRKQYTSKIAKTILNRVATFMSRTETIEDNNFSLLLDRDITRKITNFNNKRIIQNMGEFKAIIDKVTAGIKTECYLEFMKGWPHNYSKEILEYIKEKHGYNYNPDIYLMSEFLFDHENDDKVLSLAVYNDENFWNFAVGSSKTFLNFVNLVAMYHDLAHAKKLVDYAFK